MNEETKICRRCGQEKPLSEMRKRGASYHRVCKQCHNAHQRAYTKARAQQKNEQKPERPTLPPVVLFDRCVARRNRGAQN